MKKTKLVSGFTLVELLVVISIIALLLALLMPALGKAREQAMSIVDRTRIRQWGIANTTYCSENNGRFEAGFYQKKVGSKTDSTESRTKGWTEVLYPYYKGNPEILNCPKVPVKKFQDQYPTISKWKAFIDDFSAATGDKLDRTYVPWRGLYPETKLYNISGSYGKNAQLSSPPNDADKSKNRADVMMYHTLSQVKTAAQVPMFFDCFTGSGQSPDTYFYVTDEIKDGKINHSNGYPLPAAPTVQGGGVGSDSEGGSNLACRAALNRHGSKNDGATNINFVDNSTRKVYLKEMWELRWHPAYDWERHRLAPAAGSNPPSGWPQWMKNFKKFKLQ
jgi:prepilin-type N-terminal cleavage/methylation domain-containing protein